MNSIIMLGCVLCLAQISSSASTQSKIAEDAGYLEHREDVHALQFLQRNKRGTRTYVVFDNRSGRLIELWWKARGKKKEFFRSMAPGAVLTTSTFPHHQWLATVKTNKEALLLNNEKIYTPKRSAQNTRDRLIIRRQGEKAIEIGEKYIETMVVVDKTFLEYHATTEDVKRYVLLLLKLASKVLQHPSLSEDFGVKFTMTLSKLVVLKDDKREIVIKQYPNFRDGGKNLESVCSYMNKIGNIGPVEFDHKLFLTRKKFGFSGYGNRFGMCSQSRSCSLVLDAGFSSAIVIAHEVAHVLGTDDHNYGGDTSYVMAKPVTARLNNHKWSAKSKVAILENLRRNRCLNNKPSMDNFPTLHKYPGVHYPAEKQCQLEYNLKHGLWSKADHCVELRCKLPKPYDNFFYKTEAPALDGTECGTNKWCLSGSCQKKPTTSRSRPRPGPRARTGASPRPRPEPRGRTAPRPRPTRTPVHGNWGVWKLLNPCSKTCGSGISTQRRECNNPTPRNGGKHCVGRPTQVLICKIKDCPSKMSREDSLCAKEATRRDPTRKWGFYDENKVNLNCDFETDTCSWKNEKFNGQQDWILNKGKTPSAGTGPLADHTKKTQQGQYIYFESSAPISKTGFKARLSSPILAVRQACLTFWYHMHGGTKMGSLRVTKSSLGTTRDIWVKTGNQGRKWLQQQLEIEADNLYQISFVAKKDFSGFQSDIALDSITFKPGRCGRTSKVQRKDICSLTCTTIDNKSPKKITKVLTVDGRRERRCRIAGCDGIPGSGKKLDSCNVCGGDGSSCRSDLNKQENVVDCDFEKDFCQWSNKKYGNGLYWLRRKRNSGYYMFVQSYNRGRAGKYMAKMLSPTLHIPKACLSFDYKMEGRNINKLKLRLVDSARITRVVPGLRWSKRGNHGSQWLNARVNINRRTTDPYKIVIDAVAGNRRHGNIGIDNIQLRKGSCR